MCRRAHFLTTWNDSVSRHIDGKFLPNPSIPTVGRPDADRPVFCAKQLLQFDNCRDMLLLEMRANGDEEFLLTAEHDEVQAAAIWHNRTHRLLHVLDGDEREPTVVESLLALLQYMMTRLLHGLPIGTGNGPRVAGLRRSS